LVNIIKYIIKKKFISFSESSLRRTPYPSVKKRNQQQLYRRHKLLNDNDIHSSTHTIVYESSKSTDDNLSLVGSGNESDYDNNHQSSTVKVPVNNFLNSDELLLGDQNEIILNNDTHIENNNEQSDNTKISLTNSPLRTNLITSINPTTATLDDSAPPNFLAYQRDPLITRRLLDIRSHLLLNTTLDAT